ncbi:MAG TPA: hypothetical protein VHD83_04290 [Puia sp.]|nr:hypothetical protein [Puia sp.]
MTTSRPNWSLALGLPLLVMLICIIIVFSPLFALNSVRLSTAITLDLTVTAPLLYFLVIRRTSVSRMTVIRVFVAGVLVAGLLLGGRSSLLHGIKTWISPVIEGVVVGVVIWKIRVSRRQAGSVDMLTRLRAVMAGVLGSERLGDVLGSELAVFYYAVAGGPAKAGSLDTLSGPGDRVGGEFSYARASGAAPVLGVFLMAMLAEGVGLHFLIARWSVVAAWVLTGLSAYTMLQLYAHMRAMRARPIQMKDGKLYLRNGLAADVCIEINAIEEITLTTRMVRGEEVLKLALFGALEGHTVRVRLCQPVTVVRMFGIRRRASVLLFAVDKPEELLKAIQG